MSRTDRINKDLVNRIVAQYQNASFWKAYSEAELSANFTDEELNGIKFLIADMKAAADDNARKTEIIKKSAALASKLLSVAKIVA